MPGIILFQTVFSLDLVNSFNLELIRCGVCVLWLGLH